MGHLVLLLSLTEYLTVHKDCSKMIGKIPTYTAELRARSRNACYGTSSVLVYYCAAGSGLESMTSFYG